MIFIFAGVALIEPWHQAVNSLLQPPQLRGWTRNILSLDVCCRVSKWYMRLRTSELTRPTNLTRISKSSMLMWSSAATKYNTIFDCENGKSKSVRNEGQAEEAEPYRSYQFGNWSKKSPIPPSTPHNCSKFLRLGSESKLTLESIADSRRRSSCLHD